MPRSSGCSANPGEGYFVLLLFRLWSLKLTTRPGRSTVFLSPSQVNALIFVISIPVNPITGTLTQSLRRVAPGASSAEWSATLRGSAPTPPSQNPATCVPPQTTPHGTAHACSASSAGDQGTRRETVPRTLAQAAVRCRRSSRAKIFATLRCPCAYAAAGKIAMGFGTRSTRKQGWGAREST